MSVFESVRQILEDLEACGKIPKGSYQLEKEYSLSRLTSFKTGGEATVLFPEKEEALVGIIPILNQKQIPYFLLGNGSNVIAKDEGYKGLVVSLLRLKEISASGNEITASCGASITSLATFAWKRGLTGMEPFFGIPGTVGGAVYMNAGAYGGECKDVLSSVRFLTPEGEIKTLPTAELAMGYRTSIFESNGCVILSGVFSLKPGKSDAIRAAMDDFMARRTAKQPLEYPSAGSTFKRCEGRFTAQMIDEAGLKGKRVGGAMVSEKHAGFIINYENATSADIFALIALVKEEILKKEGLSIQCEVRVIE